MSGARDTFKPPDMALPVTTEFPAFYVMAATVLVVILVTGVLRRPRNLPPGPTGLPLVGCLHLLGALPHQSLAKLAKVYGPLMSLRLGQVQFIVASSPETAMEFLKKQDANFCGRPPLRAGQVMFGPDILFQNNSAVWRQLRKMFHMGLTSIKRLDATRHVRQEEVAHLLRTLPHNREFNFRRHLSVLVTSIISRSILNRSFRERVGGPEFAEEQAREIQTFQGIMAAIFKGLSAFYPGDFIPALRRLLDFQGLDHRFQTTNKRMDAFATKIIAEHQAQRLRSPVAEHETDMVHVLLDEAERCNASAGASGPRISMAHIKGIMWDAFSGGTDTILFSCEWIMAEVVRNPSVQAKARAELDHAVGRHRRVQESDLPNLPYIQAVVKEGLRLHPIAPLMAPHQSLDACKAFGYDIPANTNLFVNVWAIGRDPAVWVDPLEFRPERWLKQGPDADAGAGAIQPMEGEYLPFGAGRRMCPGMALGTVTLQYCLASLVQAFDWSVTADPGMAEAPGMGVPRAAPLRVIVQPRLPSELLH